MSGSIKSFEDIVAPLGAARFREDHLDRAPLYLEGEEDKFHDVMNWEILNRLLGTTTIWSHRSLLLVLDRETVPPEAYTSPAPGRDGGQVLRPDPGRVKRLLARGATLVANDIDQLTPELSAFARALEEFLGGKVQANLYMSSQRRQGFRVHYDTHDVFAVHVAGTKRWFVFEGRAEDPIAHPTYKNVPQEVHEKAKGKLWREIRMTPGDLLYLPRGQYHYALAEDGGCIHIAFGVTYPIGIDVVSYLFERMVTDPLGRANLPRGDRAALAERLRALGARMAELLAEPRSLEDVERQMAGFRYPRETYDLPRLLEPEGQRFEVRATGLRLVARGGRFALVEQGTRKGVEVPRELQPMVAWALERPAFTRAELDRAFFDRPAEQRAKFLQDMEKMALLRLAV